MAGASDKARFYLEQSVPELQELSRQKIFSKSEIASIAKRRSDFEHKLNARGSASADYARYVEYEMNLESLRHKRAQRLGIKTSNHTGQRRIFFILDRATKKFQGDLGLWMQYLMFARKQRSNKKVSQIMTSILRLHPTKSQVWIYAANYVMEERGDMTEARSFMQRGLRFCKTQEKLWIEYAKLEMISIAKILGRRGILGIGEDKVKTAVDKEEGVQKADGEVISLPTITADDINPDHGLDEKALEKLDASPALSGAIPIAIFDSAMRQFEQDETTCLQFYDMFAEFYDLPCTAKILDCTMEAWQKLSPESPAALARYIRQPVLGLEPTSSGFPTMLGKCLDCMEIAFRRLVPIVASAKTSRPRDVLDGYVIEWLLSYLEEEDLDPDVRSAIVATLTKVWGQFQCDIDGYPNNGAAEYYRLVERLEDLDLKRIAEPAITWALKMWPDKPRLETQTVMGPN